MGFKVYINRGEERQIQDWVLRHENIETGGDLFGLWLDDQTAVVQFVLGPGKSSERTTTSFFQDIEYLRKAGTYLTEYHGLCNIGQWHSHHRIKLSKPSVGDENTVWNNMPNLGLDRYIVFIANITYNNDVTINCFLFQMKNGRELPIQHGKFEFLNGNSPLRLNENILQNVHGGAESFNEIPDIDGEMNYGNEKEISTRKNPDVTTASVQRGTDKTEKQNTNDSFSPLAQHNPQQRDTALLVKVKSYEISEEKDTVKPVLRDDQKRDKVHGLLASSHQNNTSFSNDGTTYHHTWSGTGESYKSINSGESSYELNSRAEETVETENTNLPNRILPEPKRSNLDNKQDTSNQADIVGQKRSQDHRRQADQTITEQPRVLRNSVYDNVEISEEAPMETDGDAAILETEPETRPDTPSGTMSSAANGNNCDDEDLGWLCSLFANLKLCESGKNS